MEEFEKFEPIVMQVEFTRKGDKLNANIEAFCKDDGSWVIKTSGSGGKAGCSKILGLVKELIK